MTATWGGINNTFGGACDSLYIHPRCRCGRKPFLWSFRGIFPRPLCARSGEPHGFLRRPGGSSMLGSPFSRKTTAAINKSGSWAARYGHSWMRIGSARWRWLLRQSSPSSHLTPPCQGGLVLDARVVQIYHHHPPPPPPLPPASPSCIC